MRREEAMVAALNAGSPVAEASGVMTGLFQCRHMARTTTTDRQAEDSAEIIEAQLR
jgi:hypothetical protein